MAEGERGEREGKIIVSVRGIIIKEVHLMSDFDPWSLFKCICLLLGCVKYTCKNWSAIHFLYVTAWGTPKPHRE